MDLAPYIVLQFLIGLAAYLGAVVRDMKEASELRKEVREHAAAVAAEVARKEAAAVAVEIARKEAAIVAKEIATEHKS